MASFIKQPPILQSEEFYTEWMQDLQIWTLLTDLPKEKQGPAVFLSFPQNIYNCFRHLPRAHNGRAEGLKLITDKLDEIYLQDPNTSVYMVFKEFYSYEKDNGINVNDFLVR